MTTARVDRLWPNATVACLGTGPSLCQADVDALRGKARILAVNNAYQLCLWADALYAADDKWWRWHEGVPGFAGLKYTIEPCRTAWPGLQVLKNAGRTGLETDPTGLRSGFNSGYQAINLAVHLGAARIVLLGYDMHGDHFFGSHPDRTRPSFASCLAAFPSLVEPLAARGVSIVNCTPRTSLHAFPKAALSDVLSQVLEVAS